LYIGDHARTVPDKPAVIMWPSGDTLTYRELYELSTRLANRFRADGLVEGDRVAILAENHPRYYVAMWAALDAGFYVVPVNAKSTVEEAAYIVGDSGARALVVTGAIAIAEELVAVTPGVQRRVCLDGTVGPYTGLDELLADQPADPTAPEVRGTFMFYSSGTTGRPKGIRPPLPGAPASAGDALVVASMAMFGLEESAVYLSPAPLHHAAPLRTSQCVQCVGGTVVCMQRFDAEGALAAIERHRVTTAQWVPTMFVRLLKLDPDVRARYDLSSMRLAVHAAAPCPVWAKEQMIDWWGPILSEYYAGSENVGTTAIGSHEWLAHKGSVGRPVGCTVHICDDEGDELAAGGEGLVYFETPGVSFEYHGDPAKTAGMVHPKHADWRTLGDIGRVDDDGYLYLTDRKAFMIISGGANIYPREIEDVLVRHPAVLDAAVFGVPDEDMGEVVKAVVQPVDWSAAGNALAAELMDLCRGSLASYKHPRSIDFRAELPRTEDGKLRKRFLRDEYWK
jgi:long-chain acyl-CoA synthetase